jgi:hypothetical protein
MSTSCNTQVKDDMSSGSSTVGLANCNWFHALRPVAYNAMAAEKHPSFQPKQISRSNRIHGSLKLKKERPVCCLLHEPEGEGAAGDDESTEKTPNQLPRAAATELWRPRAMQTALPRPALGAETR